MQGSLRISDGVGNPVDFYLGTNKVGTVVDPPYIVTVTNIPAGVYNVRVGTTNSVGVYRLYPEVPNYNALVVIEPTFRQPAKLDTNSFSFDFEGTLPFMTNIVEQSVDLRTWFPIATNTDTTNVVSFRDTNAVESLRFYRMKVLTVLPLLP